jgi:hypothetical protein
MATETVFYQNYKNDPVEQNEMWKTVGNPITTSMRFGFKRKRMLWASSAALNRGKFIGRD